MVIEVKDLVKRYGKLLALDHLSLTVKKGEIYGLLGPNGSGKSTFINCMLALLAKEQGEIKLFGEEITPEAYKIKARIGLVPQAISVYEELTVLENIDYFCSLYIRDKRQRKQYVEDAIKFVGLEDFHKFHPKQLSGGLLRRLNLACGIAHKPELLILDEPTVAVDPQSRQYILDGLKALSQQGTTILYTTHYMEEVEQICDRVTIMDKGHEIVQGTVDEICNMSKHGEIYQVELLDLPELVRTELNNWSDIEHWSYDQNVLIVELKAEKSSLLNVVELLESHQCELVNLSVKKIRLNDVFLELTGKELRDHA